MLPLARTVHQHQHPPAGCKHRSLNMSRDVPQSVPCRGKSIPLGADEETKPGAMKTHTATVLQAVKDTKQSLETQLAAVAIEVGLLRDNH
ncbi:hypothetical protein NDU88_004025 [Pleurodeles waltl]|uniref:Uncharacterized protein n=1 Tax=Pleurodeles waltl TaxID=8319 RepID=A0AAV7V3J3_PLEWA|nr:hypothetical protein NDU88_004025 [Pleurodeles waltl]